MLCVSLTAPTQNHGRRQREQWSCFPPPSQIFMHGTNIVDKVLSAIFRFFSRWLPLEEA